MDNRLLDNLLAQGFALFTTHCETLCCRAW